MLRSVKSVLVAGAATMGFVALFTLAAMRSYAVYKNTADVDLLKGQWQAYLVIQSKKEEALRDELNALEKTVYSPPSPTAPTRKPSVVEQWQVNRDAEVNKRLKALETWRYRTER